MKEKEDSFRKFLLAIKKYSRMGRNRSVQFYDLGLQLALINQLMFKEGRLVPKISLGLDSRVWTEKIIAQEISQDLLKNLETLEINPLSIFYVKIYIIETEVFEIKMAPTFEKRYITLFNFRFFCPDDKTFREEKIKIDLSLLPNLKEIKINPYKFNFVKEKIEKVDIHQLGFDQEVMKILKEKNIKINIIEETKVPAEIVFWI